MEQSQIVIYKTEDGKTKIDVKMQDETVWLTQEQMAFLFNKGRSTITEHINNVFKEGELDEKSVCREFRQSHSFGRESIVIIAPDGEYSTDELTVDDVAFNTAILLKEDVSSEECIAFIYDILRAGANAHDNQNFGDEPLFSDHIAEVTGNVWELASKYYKGMENL